MHAVLTLEYSIRLILSMFSYLFVIKRELVEGNDLTVKVQFLCLHENSIGATVLMLFIDE